MSKYHKLVKVDTPQVFFEHELEQLSERYTRCYRPGYIPAYFTFVDENDKYTDKAIYETYGLDERYKYGKDICVLKRCVEERYSQSTIDACRKEHKRNGTRQYEWHLVKKPAVINTVTGECVFIAEHEMDYVYVYDNIIYYSSYFNGCKKILNWLGEVIADNVQEIMKTKTHIIAKISHNYSTDIDTVVCINKLTGNIDKTY